MVDIHKRNSMYVGSITVSGANTATTEVEPGLATPFAVRRVFMNVTTAVTGGAAEITVKWRPTPGSGAYTTLANFDIPVSAENTQLEFNVERQSNTTTTAYTGYANSSGDQPGTGYRLGSNVLNTADGLTVVGPGGELAVTSDGNPDAGVVGFWVEVETRSTLDQDAQTNITMADVT